MVRGLPSIDHSDQLSEECLLGKHVRNNITKEASTRSKTPLEPIHEDVSDPILPNSFGKKKYFLLFIDDFSRKTWLYFLKEKSEVFTPFKKFRTLVEKESGHRHKISLN